MSQGRRTAAAALVALVCIANLNSKETTQPVGRPKLIVLIVIDQMRGDYIDKYQHQWTSGLRRLLDTGAWFQRAAYPYANTLTCAGHATISTGAYPPTHGIAFNVWWDRTTSRRVSCTTDSRTPNISYGGSVSGGSSAAALRAPTLGDEMRAQLNPPARVVTMSLKARSAIMLAGQQSNATTWFASSSGAWITSAAYGTTRVPFIEQFIKQHPVQQYLNRPWTRALEPSAYLFKDDVQEERPIQGTDNAFPHDIRAKGETADAFFFERWTESPFSDDYLEQLAQAAVDNLNLGSGAATDLLAVSFSALDLVGHRFGPRSHEVQDVMVRLDRTLGTLLTHLDRRVGENQYLVALSADHGVAELPELLSREGVDAGRIGMRNVRDQVENALQQALGAGSHVAHAESGNIYLVAEAKQRLQADARARQALVNTVRAIPGVQEVFSAEDLTNSRSTRATVRALRLSFVSDRSGDYMIVPKRNWIFANATSDSLPPSSAVSHGTAHDYDQRVPIILSGPGVRRGKYRDTASPADIAPTLGHLIGVKISRAEGRVLREALKN